MSEKGDLLDSFQGNDLKPCNYWISLFSQLLWDLAQTSLRIPISFLFSFMGYIVLICLARLWVPQKQEVNIIHFYNFTFFDKC